MGKELRGAATAAASSLELRSFQALLTGLLYLIRIPCGSTARIKRIRSNLRIDLPAMMPGRPR